MHYVYLIKSLKHDFIYIGSTDDLKRRFSEHNAAKNIATKYYAPFKLIYYEAYASKKDALTRENKLKHHGSAIGHLKKRVLNSLLDAIKRAERKVRTLV
jgi:putative endonuclease